MLRSVKALLVAVAVLVAVGAGMGADCGKAETCLGCAKLPDCGWQPATATCLNLGDGGEDLTAQARSCNGGSDGSFDWPTFGGSYARDGFVNVSLTSTGGALPSPHQLASYRILSQATPGDVSASIVLGTTAYAIVHYTNFTVFAVANDITTGDLVWKTTLPFMASAVSAPSASADGATIYCQLVCFVGEGVVVFGVEAATGNVLWSIDGGSQFELYPYGPAVAVYGSQDVLFMDGEYNGMLHAVSPNGTSLYDKHLYKASRGCDYTTPTFDPRRPGNALWTATSCLGNTAMFGIADVATGAVTFDANLTAVYAGIHTETVPVVVEAADLALVTSRTLDTLFLTAIDLATQAVTFSYKCSLPPGGIIGMISDYTPASDGSVAVVSCADGVHEVDLATGTLARLHACGSESGCVAGQPLVTPDLIVVNNLTAAGVAGISRSTSASAILTPMHGDPVLTGPTGSTLVVTNVAAGTVNVIDLAVSSSS